jgi:hypothetical protein
VEEQLQTYLHQHRDQEALVVVELEVSTNQDVFKQELLLQVVAGLEALVDNQVEEPDQLC